MISSTIKRTFSYLGYALMRSDSIPFGFDWCRDARYLLESDENDGCLIDVGANVGQTVRQLRNSFKDKKIHSFEPIPATFEQLRINTEGLANVEIHNLALSSGSGSAEMVVNLSDSGRNRLSMGSERDGSVTVNLATLDSFVKDRGLTQIDLLKIDTEGHEIEVLCGAKNILSGGMVRLILCECDFRPRAGEPHALFHDLFAELDPLGYRTVAFYSGGVDALGWVWGDVLFKHESVTPPRSISCTPTL